MEENKRINEEHKKVVGMYDGIAYNYDSLYRDSNSLLENVKIKNALSEKLHGKRVFDL